MKVDNKTLLIAVLGLAFAWYAIGPGSSPPEPGPNDRPVLRWLARAAKTFLWLAVFADPPPEYPEPIQHLPPLVGPPKISHARSF